MYLLTVLAYNLLFFGLTLMSSIENARATIFLSFDRFPPNCINRRGHAPVMLHCASRTQLLLAILCDAVTERCVWK